MIVDETQSQKSQSNLEIQGIESFCWIRKEEKVKTHKIDTTNLGLDLLYMHHDPTWTSNTSTPSNNLFQMRIS